MDLYLAGERYHLIFMDVQMPELSGIEVSQLLRKSTDVLPQHQPVIVAVTANATEDDKKECLQSGMNDFLTKPLNQHNLLNMIKKYKNQFPRFTLNVTNTSSTNNTTSLLTPSS